MSAVLRFRFLLFIVPAGAAIAPNFFVLLVYRREAEAPNAICQTDHRELDIWILHEDGTTKKPWLTIVLMIIAAPWPAFIFSLRLPLPCKPHWLYARRSGVILIEFWHLFLIGFWHCSVERTSGRGFELCADSCGCSTGYSRRAYSSPF
jgi:hypothetical protein